MRPATATTGPLRLQLLGGSRVPLRPHHGNGDRRLALRGREAVGIRRLPQLFNFLQFFLVQSEKILLKFRVEHAVSLCGPVVGPMASIAAVASWTTCTGSRDSSH